MQDPKYINDLESWVKQIWLLPNIEDKRLVAIDLVDNMAFKSQQAYFKGYIIRAKNGNSIDKIATDILLSGEGLKVL